MGYKLRVVLALSLSISMLIAEKLSVESALKLASTHPDIKASLLQITQSYEDVKIQKSSWFPQISIFAEYDPQRTYTMPMNGQMGVIDDNGWSAGISIKQNLYDFSRTKYRVKAADIKKQIATLSAKDAKALIRYQVRNSYAQILVQQEAIEVKKMDLKSKKQMYKEALALYKQGLKTRADALRFKSAMEFAYSDLAMSRASLDSAVASLEQLMGEDIKKSTKFDKKFLYEGKFLTGKEAIDRLIHHNIGIKVARKSKESTHANYEAIKRQRYGSIDIVGDLTHLDTLTKYDSKTLGIRYSASVFQGGKLSAQSEQMRVQEMIDAQKVESIKRKIVQEYKELLANWKALGSSIKAQKSRIISAKETLELVKARYKEGLLTYIDVLDAQANLLSAKLGLLNAHFQRRNTLNRLEYLYGK